MPNYRRIYIKGGTYFFTLVTVNRKPLLKSPAHVNILKQAFVTTKDAHPFTMNAIVILPDHLHCIWTLPNDDDNFSKRWQQIKAEFTKQMRLNNFISTNESVWQPRFWEHLIKDENDLKNHIDYIHYNPVKHGLANSPKEWKHSTFRKYVRNGWYDENWGKSIPKNIETMEFE